MVVPDIVRVVLLSLLVAAGLEGQDPQIMAPGVVMASPPPIGGKLADVNGDGWLDFVGGAIQVSLGGPGPRFSPSIQSPLAFNSVLGGLIGPYLVGDITGDGLPDCLFMEYPNWGVATPNYPAVGLYTGDGTGQFVNPQIVFSGQMPGANSIIGTMYLADVVPGLSLELIVERHGVFASATAPPQYMTASVLDVIAFSGSGTSTTLATLSLPYPPGYFGFRTRVVGDFNGDGQPDLFGVLRTPPGAPAMPGRYEVFMGLPGPPYFAAAPSVGSGPFAPSPSVPTGSLPKPVADFNNDGYDDVVLDFSNAPPSGTDYIAVALGDAQNPLGTWVLTPMVRPTTPWPSVYFFPRFEAQDYDLDGAVDLMVFHGFQIIFGIQYGGDVQFYRGDGQGGFLPPTIIPQPYGCCFTVGAPSLDLDHDGDIDLLGWPGFFENRTLLGSGSPGAAGLPEITAGLATPGNQGFHLGIEGASPGMPALLGISLDLAPGAPTNGILLDLDPSASTILGLPLGSLVTDAAGSLTVPLPLPAFPALSGIIFHTQALVADPAPPGYALTQARTVVVW